jgi:predicted GNAT family N-acyltransferase
MEIQIEKIQAIEVQQMAWAIRKEVFVIEQACPEELEWENEEVSTHFIANFESNPVGTARYRQTEKGYKLERIAVLREFRKKGIASLLIQTMLKEIPANQKIYLHAQIQAKEVYDKNGFKAIGPLFDEAGITHVQMVYKGSINQPSLHTSL